eukprot:gene2434-3145_t
MTNTETKVVEEFIEEQGRKFKVTRKIKVTKEKEKISKKVLEREKWKPFGFAVTGKVEDGASIGTEIGEEVFLELLGEKENKKQNKEVKEQERKIQDIKTQLLTLIEQKPSKEETTTKYVPPSMRKGEERDRYREQQEMNTIRVSNLSEDVSEQELRDLFGECGYMSRCFVAYDHDTGRGKGFAFITYRDQESADEAIEKYDGMGMNYLILSVERAKPSKKM